jgi:hypothetical protein
MEAQLQRAIPDRQFELSAAGVGNDFPPLPDLSEAGTSGTSSLGSDFGGEESWEAASDIPRDNFQIPNASVPWSRGKCKLAL